jgi:23S rRNA (guanosine2251-2'-O)-methyltransferase
MRKLKNLELNRPSKEEYQQLKKIPVSIVLDNVRSMYNVGSVFRTSDAFLIEKIYLCGITSTPPHNEIYKTALGAEETVLWQYFDDTLQCIEQLQQQQYIIASIEQADYSTQLQNFTPTVSKPLALVFGNEVMGVNDTIISKSNVVIEIPQFGAKHSFNISVSVGIVLWHLSQFYFQE